MSASADVVQDGASRIWECVLCGFRYDEAIGDPDGGIAPGTRWEDVPDDWFCPECGARKSEFDMVVVG
ncbi:MULTISPECIES: rubredoxin [Chelativorans]|uniref:Rubredoxin n=1 Tax=Chelativorans salis TaxID=2978478 RepID=A0ABT2LQA2_9HYPH|nr:MULTISPECIES: rubredoxin [Chelativorans]MCT7376735.1 rubredoxin [Chelativorans sp. EGI FJ00035]